MDYEDMEPQTARNVIAGVLANLEDAVQAAKVKGAVPPADDDPNPDDDDGWFEDATNEVHMVLKDCVHPSPEEELLSALSWGDYAKEPPPPNATTPHEVIHTALEHVEHAVYFDGVYIDKQDHINKLLGILKTPLINPLDQYLLTVTGHPDDVTIKTRLATYTYNNLCDTFKRYLDSDMGDEALAQFKWEKEEELSELLRAFEHVARGHHLD